MLCRLHQKSTGRPDSDPPGLSPFPGIATLAPEKQMLLFPFCAPLSGPQAITWVRESSCSIRSFRRERESCAATRTAFLIALGLDLPCEITQMPRTPSRGAPPYSE